MRIYSIKESKKNNDGKKTTITITTEDENVVKGILNAPKEEVKNNKSNVKKKTNSNSKVKKLPGKRTMK